MYEQLRKTQRFTLVAAPGQGTDLRRRHQNGRVLDPESGLDGIRNMGITGNRIAEISTATLKGKILVDATGVSVAPGFIDLHSHAQDDATVSR
jgi:predicted amidohydrolase